MDARMAILNNRSILQGWQRAEVSANKLDRQRAIPAHSL